MVINADKVIFTGKKWKQKLYRKHSGKHYVCLCLCLCLFFCLFLSQSQFMSVSVSVSVSVYFKTDNLLMQLCRLSRRFEGKDS